MSSKDFSANYKDGHAKPLEAADKLAPSIPNARRQEIERALRRAYEEILSEPIPERLAATLGSLGEDAESDPLPSSTN